MNVCYGLGCQNKSIIFFNNKDYCLKHIPLNTLLICEGNNNCKKCKKNKNQTNNNIQKCVCTSCNKRFEKLEGIINQLKTKKQETSICNCWAKKLWDYNSHCLVYKNSNQYNKQNIISGIRINLEIELSPDIKFKKFCQFVIDKKLNCKNCLMIGDRSCSDCKIQRLFLNKKLEAVNKREEKINLVNKETYLCQKHKIHLESVHKFDFYILVIDINNYINSIKEHQNHKKCVLCNKCLTSFNNRTGRNNNSPDKWDIDHRAPKGQGGLNIWGNIQLTCFRCNQIKGNNCLHQNKVFLVNNDVNSDYKYKTKLLELKCKDCLKIIHYQYLEFKQNDCKLKK